MTASEGGSPSAGIAATAAPAAAALPKPPKPQPTVAAEKQDEAKQTPPNASDNGIARPDPMRDHASRHCTTVTRDACRCPHLEQVMFPRSLSLDCKQLDDFCMGCVDDNSSKHPGRIYIEALHFKEFLKSRETLVSEKYDPSVKGSVKREGWNDMIHSASPSRKKSRSPPRSSPSKRSKRDDDHLLSQAYFGGVQGKRAWFLSNGVGDTRISAMLGTTTDDTESLLSSEAKLVSLRESMGLLDDTLPPDSLDDNTHPDVKRLEKLTEHLPGYPGYTPSGDASPTAKDQPNSPSVVCSPRVDTRPSPSNTTSSVSPGTPPSSSKVLSRQRSSSTHSSGSRERVLSSEELDLTLDKATPRSRENFERELREGKDAALAANKLMESFRSNRRTFWANRVGNGGAARCAWCPTSCVSTAAADPCSISEFGAIRDTSSSSEAGSQRSDYSCGAAGDALIQCLECSLVGCSSKQHAALHFLMSGHRYGVTYGPLGEIFCMGCGDNVYHECFDQERERLFLEHNYPTLCWRESPIHRGIDPSSFIATPEHGVVWRGILATYPSPVSPQLAQASRFAVKRISIFRGEEPGGMITLGPKATELSDYHKSELQDQCLPVGMYNLGNTCFMSATLQCLIHCKPLRKLFLRDLVHPYQSCNCLRRGSNKLCLACEMDKLFLEYYGSAVGIDALAALEEQTEFSSNESHNPPVKNKEDQRGHPIIPSSFLAECWRNRGMKSLAGHQQHDSQEFFNAFVDCLAAHALAYQKSAHDMRQTMYQNQIRQLRTEKSSANPDADFIRKMFTGSLRSVLVCKQCGCKRTQTESFSNVSLPLAKELAHANDTEVRGSPRRGKISVDICLDHFTRPEALADPVYCPSCSAKTKTLKQHTFSQLPDVLCLHLKRFNSSVNKKITDFVAFPARDLDMGKHLPHWCEQGLDVDQKSMENYGAGCPRVMYDLFATVNHKGTLHQGHYTANVKCGDCWYTCNDAFVSRAGVVGDGEKEVLSSDGAYMLFYQKKR